jgi:tetratricopeptide (TPR) repeat protein
MDHPPRGMGALAGFAERCGRGSAMITVGPRNGPNEDTMRRLAVLCAITMLPCLAASASADEPADRSAEARRLFEEGRAALDAGDYARAEDSLERSLSLYERYSTLANLGATEIELGKPREAAEHLARALDLLAEQGGEEARARITADFEKARGRIVTLEIVVASAPADLVIQVDASTVKDPSAPLYLDPGNHLLVANAAGYNAFKQSIDGKAGDKARVEVKLVSDAPAPVPAEADEGGGGNTALLVGVIATAGLAVAAIGAGIGTRVAGASHESQGDDARDYYQMNGGCAEPCPEVLDPYDRADTLYDASTGLFVAGGVLGAAAIVQGIVLATMPDDEPAATASFVVGPDGMMVAVRGRFVP